MYVSNDRLGLTAGMNRCQVRWLLCARSGPRSGISENISFSDSEILSKVRSRVISDLEPVLPLFTPLVASLLARNGHQVFSVTCQTVLMPCWDDFTSMYPALLQFDGQIS